MTKTDPPGRRRRPRRRVRPVTLATATRTSCHAVVYIGDSTSEGEIASNYIPNPDLQLPAQLARVGVSVTFPEISGARSIVETYEGHPNAATVAQAHVSSGFHGCWILALGTNEAANVTAGSNVGLRARIDRMMSIVAGQPVLWIDAVTLVGSGPYAEDGMQQWNNQLLAACHRYANLRVFDWAAHVRRPWFISDGIHYFGPGYVARAHLFARALAAAFPARGVGPGCVVG